MPKAMVPKPNGKAELAKLLSRVGAEFTWTYSGVATIDKTFPAR